MGVSRISLVALVLLLAFSLITYASAQNRLRGSPNNKAKNPMKKPNNGQQKNRYINRNIPNLGMVRGRLGETQWTGQKMAQFFDIPYGKSPTGALRFKPSVPAEPWSGVLKTHKPHLGCPSIENIDKLKMLENRNVNLENCLRLSISTKAFKGSAPVMVYVHGEFLYDGNNVEAVPTYLLEEDVVLVSVRYRLGPFGFLSTMTNDLPGNAAVHDIILALKWIQKHITAFGGDAKRVTLFGQVGGAALINVLTLSPAVPANLFHRVIYQSASAMTPFFTTNNPLPAAKDIGKMAGCKNLNKVEALNKCLRKLNTTQLLQAFESHVDAKGLEGVGALGGAQITIGGPSKILPEHPGKLLVAENHKAYPTMGGTVKNAGSFLLKDIYVGHFNESIADDSFTGVDYVEYIIKQTNGADPTAAWTQFAKENIFSEQQLKNGSFYTLAPGLIDMCSTIAFKNPVLIAMQANAKQLPNSTFLYSFDYKGETNRYVDEEYRSDDETATPFEMGVTLTDDNLYLFPWPSTSSLSSVRDIKVAKRMVSLWTSFATTGVPSAPGIPAWPAMSEDVGPYLKIGEIVSVAENYIDEYNITSKEAAMGLNLLNGDFFENLTNAEQTPMPTNDKDINEPLEEVAENMANVENADNMENTDDADFELDLQESRGGNLIFIARRPASQNDY